MSPIKNNIRVPSRVFLGVSYVGISLRLLNLCAVSAATPVSDYEQCRSNLATIFLAIQQYRRDNQRLPNELCDLVPKYLSNVSFLKCPIVGLNAPPSAANSEQIGGGGYVYEFEWRPLTNALAQGLGITLQSWRQLQMGRIGSDLPIVRCTNHVRVLNLSFGGEIRQSGPEWESDFATVVRPEELGLDFLLPEYLHLKVVRIPARDSRTPPELLDLTQYYNGSLTDSIGTGESKTQADSGSDRMVIDGISFDVRGVIQLGSLNYPMSDWPTNVLLAVGLRCEVLAFLHGTISREAKGQQVGRYIVHYEDGSTNVLPITYGLHVLHWKESEPQNIKSWEDNHEGRDSRKISVVQKGATRLYVLRWTNPHPDLRIKYVDFVSAMTQSSPFLAAVSAAP